MAATQLRWCLSRRGLLRFTRLLNVALCVLWGGLAGANLVFWWRGETEISRLVAVVPQVILAVVYATWLRDSRSLVTATDVIVAQQKLILAQTKLIEDYEADEAHEAPTRVLH